MLSIIVAVVSVLAIAGFVAWTSVLKKREV